MLKSPHPAALAARAERTSPQVGKLGRRRGEPFLGRGVRRLGGLPPAYYWAGDSTEKDVGYDMLCPGAFIPLYMGTVKPLQLFSVSPTHSWGGCLPRLRRGDPSGRGAGGETQTSMVSSAYSSSLIRSSSSLGSSRWTRRSHPEPYGSVLTRSGFSSASALTSITSPVMGASIGDEASSDSTWPMRRLACSTSPRSGSSRAVISPIWSWR